MGSRQLPCMLTMPGCHSPAPFLRAATHVPPGLHRLQPQQQQRLHWMPDGLVPQHWALCEMHRHPGPAVLRAVRGLQPRRAHAEVVPRRAEVVSYAAWLRPGCTIVHACSSRTACGWAICLPVCRAYTRWLSRSLFPPPPCLQHGLHCRGGADGRRHAALPPVRPALTVALCCCVFLTFLPIAVACFIRPCPRPRPVLTWRAF